MQIKTHIPNKRPNLNAQGFTLIEMIGVLAVIAILAAVLIPKVFDAINSARINNAAMTCNTVKTAIVDHYSKFGTILSSNGVSIAAGGPIAGVFDKVLVTEGFLDKPFAVKISNTVGTVSNHVELVTTEAADEAPTAANSAYNLDGEVATSATVNKAVGSVVAQAVLPGVVESDAKDLNDRIDGPSLGAALGSSDLVGRVKYAASVGGAPVTVYVYLTHR